MISDTVRPVRPIASPEKAPWVCPSWKARDVPTPCEATPIASPRARGSVTRTRSRILGPITAPDASGVVSTHLRLDFSKVADAPWVGLPLGTPDAPGLHLPAFSVSAIVVIVPVVIALLAENTGHVKAVAAMTRDDLDPYLGRALGADGLATAIAGAVGGSPTTTYAEEVGSLTARIVDPSGPGG